MTDAVERKPSFRSLVGALALVWVGFAVYTVLQQVSGVLTLRDFTPAWITPGGPEIEHHVRAARVGQREVGAVQRLSDKFRRWLSRPRACGHLQHDRRHDRRVLIR